MHNDYFKIISSALRYHRNFEDRIKDVSHIVLFGDFSEEIIKKFFAEVPQKKLLSGAPPIAGCPHAASGAAFEYLTHLPRDTTLICLMEKDSVALSRTIHSIGFSNIVDLWHPLAATYGNFLRPDLFQKDLEEIFTTLALFHDTTSANAFVGKLLYFLTLNPLHIQSSTYPEYFHPECSPRPGDIIIDAGAFTGDTVSYINSVLGDDCIIHAFEPNPVYYDQLKMLCQKSDKMFANQYGLWSHKQILKFEKKVGAGSYIVGARTGKSNETIDINVFSIDDYCLENKIIPTFIKFDVEGAELQALQGSKKIIAKNKPRMAISAYHHISDLWKIPLLIKQVQPDYKYALAHHSNLYPTCDTVLYTYY